MSSALLDTQTTRKRKPQTGIETDTQTGSIGISLFRRSVQHLITSHHASRDKLRIDIQNRLKTSRDPEGYLDVLLEECVTKGGPEGLDIAIDTLTPFGSLVLSYARRFWQRDYERWEDGSTKHHINDDVWYVLLRSAARSNLESWDKIAMLNYCATDGTASIREAAIHALGDVGGVVSARLIRKITQRDPSRMVRETAQEILSDLEG
jgi:hypothetical protein